MSGRKKHMARPGLEPRTQVLNLEPHAYSASTLATESHCRPVTIFSCLIRFVPESAQNHGRTDETVQHCLCCLQPKHGPAHWPPNVLVGGKSRWPDHWATRSTCDIMKYLWLFEKSWKQLSELIQWLIFSRYFHDHFTIIVVFFKSLQVSDCIFLKVSRQVPRHKLG